MSYHYPRTAEEYWNNVYDYWDDLSSILSRFVEPEELTDVEQLKSNKDESLVRLFHKAWANAPDHRSIHSIPAWHVLCDLCSEEHVLYEDKSNPKLWPEVV